MLLNDSSAILFDGVAVFPDHANAGTRYYLPTVPELARDLSGGPAFQTTAFLAEVTDTDRIATRAVMSMDVELPVRAATLDRIRDEITGAGGQEPRLVPVPLHGGEVSLEVLGPAAGQPDIHVYTGHAPNLMGSYRAAFAVAAEGTEARVLMAAVISGNVPAVLRYHVQYLGLAPSFKASMRVHWSEVYQNLRDLQMTNYIFAADEMDKVVESLQREHAVEIEVLELDPDGASAATTALFDELKTQIVQKLFSPPRQHGEVPIEDRISRGVRTLLVSLMPGVSHTLRDLRQSQLSDTTINLNEQRVNTYPAYPQSTLAGLFDRAGGIEQRVRWVSLENLPGRVEEVVIELAAGAADLGVRRVDLHITAELPGSRDLLLDTATSVDSGTPRTVARFRRTGRAEPVIRYLADVHLDPARAPSGVEHWALPWRTASGGRIWIDVEDLLDVASVRVELDDPTVLDHSTTVEVTVEAFLANDPQPVGSTTVTFSPDLLSQRVAVIIPEGSIAHFQAVETFLRQGEPPYHRRIATLDSVHRVRNPFGQRWTMELHASADWTTTQALSVELRVFDAERLRWLRAGQSLTQQQPIWTAEFAVSSDTPQQAEVRLSRLTGNGVVRGPWTPVSGPIVSINDRVRAERRVRVELDAPQWDRDDIRKAVVELSYNAAEGPETAVIELVGDHAVSYWTHPFPDPSRPDYTWKIRVVGQDGQRWTSAVNTSAADDLTITLPDPLW